jgi:hypothetical protein
MVRNCESWSGRVSARGLYAAVLCELRCVSGPAAEVDTSLGYLDSGLPILLTFRTLELLPELGWNLFPYPLPLL